MFKNLISYIFSFIVVVLIIAIVVLCFVQNKACNEEYWQAKMDECNYYEKIENTINDGFENYIMQSGMDSSVFKGIYNSERVKKDINLLLHSILNNKDFNIDTSEIRENLDNNIRNYIRDNKILVNKTVENQIQNFENAIINTYENSIIYSSSVVKIISNIIAKIKNLTPKAITIIIILLAINIVLIIILNVKRPRNILKFIAVIAFSIAGLSVIGIMLEKHFLGIQNLTVLNENISILVQIFVKEIYNILYVATVCGIVLGVITSIFCYNTNKRL